MRILILATVAALALPVLPAAAVENFIPLGQNYAPGNDEIPPLGSEQDRINAQVDVYQTEAYKRDRDQKVFESRMFQLFNQQDPGQIDDTQLDY